MKWKYLAAWFPGVLIAIANGTLRQFVYVHFLDELRAHQLSAFSFTLFFGAYVWLILPRLRLSSSGEAVRVGFTWLMATVAFEFLFGHFVMGHPWELLVHDYNMFEGRLWVVVLGWVTIAPATMQKIRNRKP